MSTLSLSSSAWPAALWDLLRSLRRRDQDPRLDEMRWRLHLRLLLISAALSSAFFFINLTRQRLDETGLAALGCVIAWAWLQRHPQHSRLLARVNLGFFLSLGVYALFGLPGGAVHWALLAMTIMTVFGTLLDGLLFGGIAAGLTSACALAVLAQGQVPFSPLSVAFAIPASLSLFATGMAHTWLFNQLVARQRASALAVQRSSLATEHLARTLSEEVTQATQRLQDALRQGLDGLGQAQELRAVLSHARLRLPEALPRESVDPTALLEGLRASVHRFFLGVAFLVALSAVAIILALGALLWELAAMVAVATAMLLWLGDTRSPRWRWRLHAFLLACLASMAADVLLSTTHPPAASLVFLPLIVFYAGMLGRPALAFAVYGAGVLVLLLAHQSMDPLPGHATLLLVLGLTSGTMAAISAATVPLYQRLLGDLGAEEERLHASLQSYRRLVSTLFHDLANPLAVLQGLAALPPSLHAPGDLDRARRMVERLRSVGDSARFSAVSSGHGQQPVSVQALAESLADVFEERLRERGLSLQHGDGLALQLRQGGSLLRDSILGNLLSNAIKFSPAGGRILLSAWREDGGTWLRLRDEGPGFGVATLQALAKGNAPKPTPGANGETGSGFGLLLAQSYAKDLGGALILSNRAEGGAQADLWLPD